MKTVEDSEDAALLGAAMRLIRTHRRMRPAEIAAEMGIPIRTYEHLEAGRARVTYDRMSRFAAATDCDAAALSAAIQLRDPNIALHCADTKLMSVLLMAFGELNEKLGPDLALIETRTMIGGATRLCRELAEHVAKRDTFAEHWLAERAATRPAIPRLKPNIPKG